ncbi:MAG: DUF3048 domain-containing protein, partial [Anaerolineaceae bacterium]|nr:DUF3048 domain-containing protein [Anaerolineaceae bacterium]
MNMHRRFLLGAAVLVLTGCVSSAPVAGSASPSRQPIEATRPAVSATVGAPKPSSTPAASPTALPPTVIPTGTPFASGPDEFPAGVNPLSGLPVSEADLDNLKLAPALVSISNFPIDTRPQAGLSYSPLVFEIYIGVGQSRFLALFYGDYPPTEFAAGEASGTDVKIGPIRSGRLPYETLRRMYHGFMVISGASKRVLPS